ncbi:RHS repeat-associated core domain-containing protein [Actinomadura meridiana]|uniref:RHS repeat-associated core domain-containing protein n=1 Tax=Actinomadura meridiana TaxID=559626 RepID=A0ABP8BVX6_9ACTN
MVTMSRRQIFAIRWPLRHLAAGMTVVLAVGLASAPAAQADPPHSKRPKVADHERTVEGKASKVRPRSPDAAGKPGPAARAAWPKPGTVEIVAPGREVARSGSSQGVVRAEGSPVALAPPGPAVSAAQAGPVLRGPVNVAVLDRATAARAGVEGLLFTLTAPGRGRVGVRVDYAAFAQAFGGSYGSRLRLVQLPGCAVIAPVKPECRASSPIPSTNSGESRTLAADVTTTSGTPTVLAAVAAPAGSQGDYSATKLQPSATWKASGNTGDFTWSYPIKGAPVPGGLVPGVALAYSAQSVDGRTTNANSQPSWVGEGFDFWPGFIEQGYKPCAEDGAPKDPQGRSPGDLCWGYENATVTWNGKGGELVKATDGTWRLKNDDGTKFEKLTSLDTGNGDHEGEYWKVTTTDGTRYYFGLNRLPGFGSGGPESNSAWTVPVFGDDAAEPCHKDSGFADSWCQQAWRWNLDMVVDPHDNAAIYLYDKETNYYGRNLKPADATPYTRGGYLKSIEYGLRGDNVFAGAPPAYIQFDKAERCIPTATFDCAPAKIDTSPDQWWDVPWDMNCTAGQECKDGHGSTTPTFWTRYRLKKITTRINRGAGWPARDVDSWTLDHHWGAVNDERDLLLKEVQHTGLAGATTADDIALPKVTFNHEQKANRLDQAGDGLPAYIRYRVTKVFDESGGELDINYSDPECSRASPPTPQTNTKRCYPLLYQVPGSPTPVSDWFNKYVVTSVVQKDRTGHAPDMATQYQYLGGAAWHFDDDDGLTREKNKTWSQWRGYGQVRVTTGSPAAPSTQTDTYYLRGMHGDRAGPDGGTKTVTVPDGEGGTHTDAEGLDGFELKTVHYTAPGGSVHDKTVNTPWRQQTASRTRSWGTVTATAVQVGTVNSWLAMDGGAWRQTRSINEFETDFTGVGRVKTVNDLADVAVTEDDRCTRTEYADNTGKWMLAYPSRMETVAVACTQEPDRSKHVLSDARTYYDNGDLGAEPSKGDVTKTEKIAEHDGSHATYVTDKQATFDTWGRPLTVTDALGQTTTTRYTQTQGLTTKTVTTTPPATPGDASTALTTIQVLDPAWGAPTSETEPNNLRTDLAYDALGRLQKVWRPDRSKAQNQTPSLEFGYQVAEGQIVAITTKTLKNDGTQRIGSIDLLDGWLRARQTQVLGPDGRLITDTLYDDRGEVSRNYDFYSAAGAPTTALFTATDPANIETQAHHTYDGLGRKTVERLMVGDGELKEKWRTTTTYGGNWTAVDPPAGATPTAEFTDARGQVIERRQYQGAGPTGTYDGTAYGYDRAGNLTKITDPSGTIWSRVFDLRGRTTSATDPDSGTTALTYDDLDRVTSSTDARDRTLVTSYDGLGRRTQLRDGSGTGNVLASWAYDTATRGKGLLASSTRHGEGGDYVTRVPGYDPLGRPESTQITVPSSEGPLGGTYTFGQTYNLDGTLNQETLPAAGGLPAETLSHGYDAYLRPTRLSSELATYVGTTGYTPTGKPKLLEFGATGKRIWNEITWEHGTQRLATSRSYRENIAGDLRNATYGYDDAGNILNLSDVTTAGTDTQCFRHDYLQRLTDAWTVNNPTCPQTPGASAGPAPYRFHYTYKTDGNRSTEQSYKPDGTLQSTRTFRYHGDPGVDGSVKGHMLGKVDQTGANPFTGPDTNDENYTYDPSGNPATRTIGDSTQTLTWNTEGDLTKIAENATVTGFVYDANGNRLLRKDPGGTTLYLPGTELRRTTGSDTVTGTRYYDHLDQTVAMRDALGVRHLTEDHQGTSNVAVNATDQQSTTRRFTPFGQPRGTDEHQTWPGERGFVGGTADPSGLTHLGAREYDPNTGRFISGDPVMNVADPQQLNGYSYGGNNPVTDADPSGLCPPDRCGPGVMNVGHDKPATTGGCGLQECGPANYVPKPAPSTSHGCTAGQAYMVAVCGDSRMTSLSMADNPKPPVANPSFGQVLHDAFSIWGEWLGYPDLKNCVTGKSKAACVWTVVSIIPVFGKDLKPFLRALAKLRRAEERADPVIDLARHADGPCNSFVPETKVLMADGSHKPIEEIKSGDMVLATDPSTGETSVEPVLDTITTKGDKKLVQLTIDANARLLPGGQDDNPEHASLVLKRKQPKSGVVIATDQHPFWVAGDINTWVKATDLKPGMWLRTSAGTYVQITATNHTTAAHQRVHNLTIAIANTYYVLADNTPVLVHNSTKCGDIALGLSEFEGDPLHLHEFATSTGATHYHDWPSQGEDWVNEFKEFVTDGETNIHFNLNGIDDPVAAARAGSGLDPIFDGHSTAWELSFIRDNPKSWSRVIFYRSGEPVANPFAP